MEYLFASIVGAQEVKQSIIFGVRLISSSILLANAIIFVLSMIVSIEITPEILSRTKERLRTYPKIILLYIMMQQPKHTNSK